MSAIWKQNVPLPTLSFKCPPASWTMPAGNTRSYHCVDTRLVPGWIRTPVDVVPAKLDTSTNTDIALSWRGARGLNSMLLGDEPILVTASLNVMVMPSVAPTVVAD